MPAFRFVLMSNNNNTKLSEDEIHRFEEQYQLVIPDVLREYYLSYNGYQIAEAFFIRDGTGYSVRKITPLLGKGDSVETMLDNAVKYDDVPAHLIPLADDRGNGLYYWDKRNEHVYFRYVDDIGYYTFICKGLDHFFEILNQSYWRDTEPAYDITSMTRSDMEMAKVDFLPLGSIVLLKGGVRKLLVIARGLNVKKDNETYFFDYGGVLYPDGLTGDEMVYFNADSINKVYFQGYQDDDNDIVLENLNTYMLEHPDIKRADPEKWNA